MPENVIVQARLPTVDATKNGVMARCAVSGRLF